MGTLASGSIDLKSLKVAGSGATSYITTIDNGGIKIHDAGDSNNYIQLTSNGMTIYKGGTADTNKLAEFGTTVTIGKKTSGNSHIEITSSAINFYDGVGLSGFINLKGSSSSENYHQVINNQEQLRFNNDYQAIVTLDYQANNGVEVVMTINGTTHTFSLDNSGTSVTRNISGYGDVILQYDSNEHAVIITNEDAKIIHPSMSLETDETYFSYQITRNFPSFSFGIGNESIGNSSFAEGLTCRALKTGSHAEGINTLASQTASHAEGNNTKATGLHSHAEGNNTEAIANHTHAEGYYTIASGLNSHAEGVAAEASGRNSHAQGSNTIAQGRDQTVIGHYNIAQGTNDSYTNSDYAFIIGNGGTSGRSDALEVDWSGNVNIASGAKYKINGNNLSASDVGALSTTGGTISGNLGVTGNITVANHLTAIGYTNNDGGSTKINSATSPYTPAKLSGAITLSTGTYVLIGEASFPGNATGIRHIEWKEGANESSATTILSSRITTSAAPATAATKLQSTVIVNVTGASQNYYLYCYHTSGVSQMEISYYWKFVRIV